MLLRCLIETSIIHAAVGRSLDMDAKADIEMDLKYMLSFFG